MQDASCFIPLPFPVDVWRQWRQWIQGILAVTTHTRTSTDTLLCTLHYSLLRVLHYRVSTESTEQHIEVATRLRGAQYTDTADTASSGQPDMPPILTLSCKVPSKSTKIVLAPQLDSAVYLRTNLLDHYVLPELAMPETQWLLREKISQIANHASLELCKFSDVIDSMHFPCYSICFLSQGIDQMTLLLMPDMPSRSRKHRLLSMSSSPSFEPDMDGNAATLSPSNAFPSNDPSSSQHWFMYIYVYVYRHTGHIHHVCAYTE